MMKQQTRGMWLILLSALAFGSYGVWSKLLGTSMGVFYPGWTRAVIIALMLLPVLHYTKQIVPVKKADWGWLSVFLIFTSLTQAPLFYAFNHMDIGTATLLFFVSMLLTMYSVGFLFLKEPVTPIKIVSFIVACIGMFLTFSFSVNIFLPLAAFMAVLNGIASGGEVAFSKKLSGSYAPLYLTWLSWLIIIPTNALISVLVGEAQLLPSLSIFWLYQVLYGLAGLLGFWLIIEGLKQVEASIGGLIGLLEIVFSIAFGIVIFNEMLTTKIIIGAILIMTAAALPHIVDLKNKLTF